MRVAVIGHVEWVEFARVERVPRTGEIIHASETWEEPGGGGPVAAVQLLKLAGGVDFFTALGDDPLGHAAQVQLTRLGVQVHAVFRPEAQRRAFVYVDASGERTITVIGERLGPSGRDTLPWHLLEGADAVYFTAGDQGALEAGRRARVLVATSRVFDQLVAAHVPLDAVVGSGVDTGERYVPRRLSPPPKLVVLTRGRDGGTYETAEGERGTYPPARPPGPVVDAYGSGDSFVAGLTYALGSHMPREEALAFAARCGAAALTGRGAYAGQLDLRNER